METTFKRYSQNLRLVERDGINYVQSYSTLVAVINYSERTLTQIGYWSMTTQKHINYVADELCLELIKPENMLSYDV